MRGRYWIAPALLALAACGGEQPAVEEPVAPAKLPAGEWEVSSTVSALQSTDGSTPDLALKQGETTTHRACVAADGTPDTGLWLARDDNCTATSLYMRSGRVNGSYKCSRPGKPGQVLPNVDGRYTADSFDIMVVTSTYFSGTGDYNMTQKMKGRRLGDCPPGGVAETNAAS